MRGRRLVLLAGLALAAALPATAEDVEQIAVVVDGREVTRSARLAPGVHLVENARGAGVLVVRTDGVTLDLGGATLAGAPADAAPDTLTGVGILVENARGVTVRNGSVRGFKVGIRAVHAPGLQVLDVDASGNFKQRLGSTPEREDAADWLWPHDNDEGEWEARYGAGISLNDCVEAEVLRCRVRGGQNGLLLTRSADCQVHLNDFSFNSGWGLALYRTSGTQVTRNRLDFCVRGYSHGVYHRGQDSAAILVFEQSCRNFFDLNSATHSGDGFFLYAGHETTQRTGRGGSNDNQVYRNDFSYAVANGIEATFSTGNVFEGNDGSGSDYGIWAGYSYGTDVVGNVFDDCLTAGVAIEHGHANEIRENRIHGGRRGVHLWWDEDPDLVNGVYGQHQDCSSSGNVVWLNDIEVREQAIRLEADVDADVRHNVLRGEPARLAFLGATRLGTFGPNDVVGSLEVENRTGGEVVLREAADTPWIATVLPVRLDPPTRPGPEPRRLPYDLDGVRAPLSRAWPQDLPRGRDQMRIDEWGPVDPRETRLFPRRQAAAGPEAKVFLLGNRPFRVVSVGQGVRVEPTEGAAPATLVVRPEGEGPALRPFALEVLSDGRRHVAEGTLAALSWDVRFFATDAASDPLLAPEGFARLLAGEPPRRERTDALDRPWRTGGPEGVPADGFATLATAEVALPAGRYRFRVTSDDGVRLFVDGRMVLERWDRHGPTEDVAELDLDAGTHALRVEHFELDGWAWLSVRLEPVP